MLNLFPNSLSFRLLSILSVWTVAALVLTGFLLSTLFRQNSERDFENLLLAHAKYLMGAIEIDDQDELIAQLSLEDSRFLAPSSGWYWAVSKREAANSPLLVSPSIANETIQVPSSNEIKFFNQDDVYMRTYRASMIEGQVSQRLEAQFRVGEDGPIYQVMIAGNRGELEESMAKFRDSLLLYFGLFGLGTMLATYFVVSFGLRPLGKVTNSLSDVREGREEFLVGSFPKEINPLAQEINALIGANIQVMERARSQVGNLAHALKTPLAVIMNEARNPDEASIEKAAEQAETMQSQIGSYLNRARIAAQRGALTARSPIMPVITRLIRVMEKLNPNMKYELVANQRDTLFRGEEQDLEEILGNLLENASRFAASKIQINVDEKIETSGQKVISIEILDDGPGLTNDEIAVALKRGQRLDETTPGSGLGLSIVRDIVDEYHGNFVLTKNETGGLKAELSLPCI